MFDPNTTVAIIALLMLLLLAGIYLLNIRGQKPQSRVERKLAKMSVPKMTVVPGGPVQTGRPQMLDVRDVVADLNRPTAVTVNTVLQRRGFSRSSLRLVRSLLRRLAKNGLVKTHKLFPGAPNHLPLRYSRTV